MKIEEDEKYFKSGEIHCICGCFFKYELEDIKNELDDLKHNIEGKDKHE